MVCQHLACEDVVRFSHTCRKLRRFITELYENPVLIRSGLCLAVWQRLQVTTKATITGAAGLRELARHPRLHHELRFWDWDTAAECVEGYEGEPVRCWRLELCRVTEAAPYENSSVTRALGMEEPLCFDWRQYGAAVFLEAPRCKSKLAEVDVVRGRENDIVCMDFSRVKRVKVHNMPDDAVDASLFEGAESIWSAWRVKMTNLRALRHTHTVRMC